MTGHDKFCFRKAGDECSCGYDAWCRTHPLAGVATSCSRCGTSDRSDFLAPRITVTIDPYSGEYCQTCYARWLSENIPKLAPKVLG